MQLAEDAYGPDILCEFLVEFIRKNKNRPFLAYYPMVLVHDPFLPTPDSVDRHEKDAKKNFVDMVNYMDKCVGRVLDALETNGLRENTLVIFTGDNGTNSRLTSMLGDKQIRGGKGYTHDYGTHVPMIVNWPGRVPGGQTNGDLICFSDIFPTLVNAAGLPPKVIANGDGWSFWPQCLGQTGKKRDWIYTYYFPRPYAKRFDDKYNHWEARWGRNVRYKLYGNGAMYDTREDVLETHPLPADHDDEQRKETRKELQRVLDSYPKTGQGVDRSRVKATVAPRHRSKQ